MATILLAFCGRKRSGKDSCGEALTSRRWGGWKRFAFADRVKAAAKVIFGLTQDQCYGTNGVDREIELKRWGLSPRYILQRLGTEVGRAIHRDVWALSTLHEAQDHMMNVSRGGAVITDCRFPNEAQVVRDAGGYVVKVVRPSVPTPLTSQVILRLPIPASWKVWLAGKLGDHASEFCVDLIKPDFVIVNDQGLITLRARVMKLERVLQHPGLRTQTLPRGKAIPVT